MGRPILRTLLADGGRIRPAWRLIVFFLFFFVLSAAGNVAISALPRSPLGWGSLLVGTLAALLAGWVAIARLDQRPPGALGFPLHRGALTESAAGTGLGAILLAAAVVLLLLTGAATFQTDAGSTAEYVEFLGSTFLFFALAATFEEVLFRGYPFQVLVEWIGVWPATVGASALFAFLHAQNPNVTPLALANIFLAGVMLSLAYLRTLSLWFATGVHTGWNWTMASLFDFPVSGLEFDTPLYDGVEVGPALWTGGAFGPEAGIAGTIVLVAAIYFLWKTPGLTPSPATLERRPLVAGRLRKERLT